jgi:hypothetical protein
MDARRGYTRPATGRELYQQLPGVSGTIGKTIGSHESFENNRSDLSKLGKWEGHEHKLMKR